MKKFLSLTSAMTLFVASLIFFSNDQPIPAYAAEETGIIVQVYDKVIHSDSAPAIVKDGRTMLPFRAIFEELGAKVSFDKNTGKISAEYPDMQITMTVGSKQALVAQKGSQKTVTLSTAPLVKNGQTYVPVRDIANISGLTVDYSSYDSKINIYDKQRFFDEINKNFTIFNKILKNSTPVGLDQTYRSTTELSGDFEVLDDNQTKKISGTLSLDGLSRGLDFNGKLNVKINLGDFEKDFFTSMTESEKELAKNLLLSEHRIIFDSNNAVLYAKSDVLSTLLEKPKNSWLKFDDSVSPSMFLDYLDTASINDLIKNSKNVTLAEYLYESAVANDNYYSEYAPTIYDQVQESAKMVAFLFGDDGFKQSGSSYTMDLNKSSFISRLNKYFPGEFSNSDFDDIKQLNYKIVLSDIETSNPKVDLRLSGIFVDSNGKDTSFDLSVFGDKLDAKATANISTPDFGKIVINMKSTQKPSTEKILLAPAAGESIIAVE